ncbi:transmembrane protein 272 [Lates calcarifer]|uniref:Transmembrane protein 272 n=1 Tax=Lates calcarifer TaxID=8187 RepID=A0AAJ8DLN0_LATCA|nr:transmembrane protein 272 [Lates calcarifer]XP_050923338.1 transmembrane protein 272 [Lates calcarifer]
MDSSRQVDFRPRSAGSISALVVVNIIWWMVMIAAIGMGTIHLGHCQVEPNIPIYLIVMGAASVISLCLTYTGAFWDDGAACVLSSACIALLHLFTFCWFIAGTVWVYSVYPPSYTPGKHYCHKTVFQFAFIVTTFMWVVLSLMFVLGCCCAALACCKTVRAVRLFIPNRYSFYGGTTDYQDISAGDV